MRFKIEKYPELNQYIEFDVMGDLWIKEDVTEEDIRKYKEIRRDLETCKKYSFFHTDSPSNYNSEINSSVFYIPYDIYPYIWFDGQKIIAKKNTPNRLRHKICDMLDFLNTELPYYIEIKHCYFPNGVSINLPYQRRKDGKPILIKKSIYKIGDNKKIQKLYRYPYMEYYRFGKYQNGRRCIMNGYIYPEDD